MSRGPSSSSKTNCTLTARLANSSISATTSTANSEEKRIKCLEGIEEVLEGLDTLLDQQEEEDCTEENITAVVKDVTYLHAHLGRVLIELEHLKDSLEKDSLKENIKKQKITKEDTIEEDSKEDTTEKVAKSSKKL